jgi:hypothetical protein
MEVMMSSAFSYVLGDLPACSGHAFRPAGHRHDVMYSCAAGGETNILACSASHPPVGFVAAAVVLGGMAPQRLGFPHPAHDFCSAYVLL